MYFFKTIVEVIIINNESYIIKCKIDNNLNTALRKILEKNKITLQDLLEQKIKEYVIENVNVLIDKGSK